MIWKATPSEYPENSGVFHYRTYNGSEADRTAWFAICREGLLGAKPPEDLFRICMLEHPDFNPNSLFFVELDGKPVATVTALAHPGNEGEIHMVGALSSCRGRGVGGFLNRIALAYLWEQGCTHAFLTTDDFRIPAIKSYLKAGFLPVRYGVDMEQRWGGIVNYLGRTNVPMVDEQGNVVLLLNEL